MIPEEIPILQPNEQELTFIFKGKKFPIFKGIFYSYSRKFQCTPSIQQQTEFIADFDVSENSFRDFIQACQGHSFRITEENIFDLQYLSSYWGVTDLSLRINKIIEGDSTGFARLNSIIYKIQRNINTDDDEHMLAASIDKYINDDRILSFPIDILKKLIYSPAFANSTKLDHDQKLTFLKKCLEKHGKEASSIFSDLVSNPLSPTDVESLLNSDPTIYESLQPLPRNLAVTCYIENKKKNAYMDISQSLNEAIRNIVLELKSQKSNEDSIDKNHSVSESYFDEFDFTKSIKDIEHAVSLGDPEAAITLSYFYKYGIGVAEDQEKASKLLEKASQMPKEIQVECNFSENEKPQLDKNLNEKLNLNDELELVLDKPNSTNSDSQISPRSPDRKSARSRLPRKSSFEMKTNQGNKGQNDKHVNFSNTESPKSKRKRSPASPQRRNRDNDNNDDNISNTSHTKLSPRKDFSFKNDGIENKDTDNNNNENINLNPVTNEEQKPVQNESHFSNDNDNESVNNDNDNESVNNDIERDKDKETDNTNDDIKEESLGDSDIPEKQLHISFGQSKADVEDNTDANSVDSLNINEPPRNKTLISKKSIDSLDIDSDFDPNSMPSPREPSMETPQPQQSSDTTQLLTDDLMKSESTNDNDNDNENDTSPKVEVPAESSELANDAQSIEDIQTFLSKEDEKTNQNPEESSNMNEPETISNQEPANPQTDQTNVIEPQEDTKTTNENTNENTKEDQPTPTDETEPPTTDNNNINNITPNQEENAQDHQEAVQEQHPPQQEPSTQPQDQPKAQKEKPRINQISSQNSITGIFGSRRYKQICKSYDSLTTRLTGKIQGNYTRSGDAIGLNGTNRNRNRSRIVSASGAEDGNAAANVTSGSGRLSSDVSKSHMPYAIEDTANVEFLSSDPERALAIMREKVAKRAEASGESEKKDVAQSAFALGIIYWQGLFGAPHDGPKSIHYYEIAASLGEARAMFNLGTIYDFDFETSGNDSSGQEVHQDLKLAVEWYEKACALDNPFAETNLGTMYFFGNDFLKQDVARAIELFERAANQGDSDAQTNLGIIYFFGRGTEVDIDRAASFFESASNQEDSDAQLMLGIIYEDGLSSKVPQDASRAVDLYRKAAEQGNSNAQFDLGTCYQQGVGVERDFEKVIEWYSRAAQNGHVDAMYNLAVIYQTGVKEEDEDFMELDDDDDDDFIYMIKKDMKKSLRYYKRAAEMNHPDALFNLGILTLENDIDESEADDEKEEKGKLNEKMDGGPEKVDLLSRKEKRAKDALIYFQRAAEAGCPEALFYLGTLYESGSPPPKNEEEEEEEKDEEDVNAVINVSKDVKKAVEYYAKAAELGHMSAQYNLAVIYTNGDEESGVPADREKAIELFKLAADQGDTDAEYNLKQILADNDAQ